MGAAVPHHIGRHAHPAARPDPVTEPTPTGIDYLRLIEVQRDHDLATAGGIEFHQLTLPDELIPKPKTINAEGAS
jgi:putative transposase